MTADRLLAIDVGTQSVRAMVFDPAGNLLARTKVPIEPYVPGPPGCCEQDACDRRAKETRPTAGFPVTQCHRPVTGILAWVHAVKTYSPNS